MSTILWLDRDSRPSQRRPSKDTYAVVRFFAPGLGFSKEQVPQTHTDWKPADVMGLVKASGPAAAWQTYAAQIGQERFGRFTHSLFVVLPVEDLLGVEAHLEAKLAYPSNVTRLEDFKDHDGHPISVVTIY